MQQKWHQWGIPHAHLDLYLLVLCNLVGLCISVMKSKRISSTIFLAILCRPCTGDRNDSRSLKKIWICSSQRATSPFSSFLYKYHCLMCYNWVARGIRSLTSHGTSIARMVVTKMMVIVFIENFKKLWRSDVQSNFS